MALQWSRRAKLSNLRPPCTCPRGEALLRAEVDRWVNRNGCCTPSMTRASTPRSTCTHFQSRDPVDWSTMRRIVYRLNECQTISSAVRKRENARRKRRNPTDFVSTSGKISRSACESQIYPYTQSPRTRPSLFDVSGQFKTLVYLNQFQRGSRIEQNLNRLSRPTTASGFKQRGRCLICDRSPGQRTIFGVVLTRCSTHLSGKYRPRDRTEEMHLVQRVSRPTYAQSADRQPCRRAREWTEAPTGPLPEGGRFYLSGEAIVQRIAQSAKTLPLVSGLPRSSSVNSITVRLYSGKSGRNACDSSKNHSR
ncbi:unnamed protein product [Echinostoma caproni]|uniref:Uncharacterized protein n=1 Tax=Echinostoma caproni TaxID=27848 RepID=A0A3P8KUE3_9TREM|nr:unnamed protein product [Echinostoma caproni]